MVVFDRMGGLRCLVKVGCYLGGIWFRLAWLLGMGSPDLQAAGYEVGAVVSVTRPPGWVGWNNRLRESRGMIGWEGGEKIRKWSLFWGEGRKPKWKGKITNSASATRQKVYNLHVTNVQNSTIVGKLPIT